MRTRLLQGIALTIICGGFGFAVGRIVADSSSRVSMSASHDSVQPITTSSQASNVAERPDRHGPESAEGSFGDAQPHHLPRLASNLGTTGDRMSRPQVPGQLVLELPAPSAPSPTLIAPQPRSIVPRPSAAPTLSAVPAAVPDAARDRPAESEAMPRRFDQAASTGRMPTVDRTNSLRQLIQREMPNADTLAVDVMVEEFAELPVADIPFLLQQTRNSGLEVPASLRTSVAVAATHEAVLIQPSPLVTPLDWGNTVRGNTVRGNTDQGNTDRGQSDRHVASEPTSHPLSIRPNQSVRHGILPEASSLNIMRNAVVINLQHAQTIGFKRVNSLLAASRGMPLGQFLALSSPTTDRQSSNRESLPSVALHDRDAPGMSASTTDFTPGELMETGHPFDIAIDGPGFLEVASGAGQRYLTRCGRLHVDAGQRLAMTIEQTRFHIPGIDLIPPDATGMQIAENGDCVALQSTESTGIPVGRIRLVTVNNPHGLRRSTPILFQATADSGDVNSIASGNPTGTVIRQGVLERSNVPLDAELQILDELARQIEGLRTAQELR